MLFKCLIVRIKAGAANYIKGKKAPPFPPLKKRKENEKDNVTPPYGIDPGIYLLNSTRDCYKATESYTLMTIECILLKLFAPKHFAENAV